jgi:uncharacterized membrane protein YfcA
MFGLDILSPAFFALACAIALFAGAVKGAVGFAMPMLMISGLGSFLPAEVAVAALIGPTVASNILQAFRQGTRAAWDGVVAHRRYLVVAAVVLVASAQLVAVLESRAILGIIGGPIVLFGVAQLLGWTFTISERGRPAAELGFGTISGFFGGIAGVWGPPLVVYLTALGTPKQEQVRVQGAAFGLGALLLLASHLQSGVVNAQTAPFSLALIVPAGIGMWLGFKVQDRLDQALFRKATLFVLVLAGLNLLRRSLLG